MRFNSSRNFALKISKTFTTTTPHYTTIRMLSKTGSSNMSSEPAYGLNDQLSIDTPEPPVPMAKAWAASYPSRSSPFYRSSSSHTQPSQPLLNLAQGVPGHEPHARLVQCMEEERVRNPMETHGYGNVFGHDNLRKSLANDINRMYDGNISENEVAITAGANLAATITFHSIAKPGEGIVLPTPWYFNHQMTLASLGIKPIPLKTQSPSFLPEPKALEDLLQQYSKTGQRKIKGVVLVTPNNPTGSIYPANLIEEFAQVCRSNKIALIMDETYRDFLLEGDAGEGAETSKLIENRRLAKPHTLFEHGDDSEKNWQNCLISIHSFSKSYAIPGHRLGAIISHPYLLISKQKDQQGQIQTKFGNFAKSLDNMQICPARMDTQRAVAICIEDEKHILWRNSIANDLAKRRKFFFDSLQEQISFTQILSKLQVSLDDDQHSTALLQISREIDVSKSISPKDLGWQGLSSGAYYAYVRHPFHDIPSQLVARGLAALVGVVVLPGSFFQPKEEEQNDRDLRFSIANVESSKLETLSARLILFTYLWKIKGAGWGL